jgi:hypothetical protein
VQYAAQRKLKSAVLHTVQRSPVRQRVLQCLSNSGTSSNKIPEDINLSSKIPEVLGRGSRKRYKIRQEVLGRNKIRPEVLGDNKTHPEVLGGIKTHLVVLEVRVRCNREVTTNSSRLIIHSNQCITNSRLITSSNSRA